ncbi:CRISPR-associated helicase Cas3' [Streptomyces sp. NPDC086033]|uniref:CRISPR-associated helicase Cas3' n=1 Tax=Streptomyces sp. NPDC086033 TaxID=3365747 RepID=UPI0037CCFD6F
MGVREDARRGGIDLTPWGKFDREQGAVHPLLFHLLDVAALAGAVWDLYLTRGQRRLVAAGLGLTVAQARCLVMFVAGLHDLGKLSAFQEQEVQPWARVSDTLRADTRNWRRMPHERASMHSALHLLAEAGYPADTSDSPGVLIAQILGGHHGRFLQIDIDGAAKTSRVNLALGGPAWQDLRRRYFALLRHLTGATAVPSDVSVPAAVLITGVGIIADRLASQRHYWLPKAQAPAFGAGEHFAHAVQDAPGVIEESGLVRITLPQVPFTQAHGLDRPNDFQASVIGQLATTVGDKGPGILVVTDATGGGKTVTALEAAQIFNASGDTAGILWLLPTIATTDAAYDLLEAYVAAHHPEHASVSLVHSHSYDNTAYNDHRLAAHEPSTSDAYWPDSDDGEVSGAESAAGERPEERVTVPDGWLRGWDRALLAQFTVATHDQALMAALPVRFSALRLLALSGRTVIVDEVHALPPFMRQTLSRLLHWLGALGCPVVLLSATLPGHISAQLVRSYLDGAGHPYPATAHLDCRPPYPGWLYAAASDASLTRIDPAAAQAHADRHRRRADLRLHPVRHPSCTDPEDTPARENRLERITREIAPVARSGGCAAVYCATMADAQATYTHLRTAFNWPDGGPDGQLLLLHARLPGHQREALTRRIRTALSATGERPRRLVVITTSLLDMSLDIDVDVMVSDLAPLQTLLQRLGRLWRFDHIKRPDWLCDDVPRLIVLEPTDHRGRTLLPPAWRPLDSPYLPLATAAHLARRPEQPLTLPDDVQQLVETVHGDADALARTDPALHRNHTLHQARTRTEEHHSLLHLVPAWHDVLSLSDLHRQNLHPREAATRLGAMPRRLLPVYRTPAGRLTLDAASTQPLPEHRKPTTAQIRTILQHTLPVPAAWVAHRARDRDVPLLWRSHALLADLILLPQDADDPTRPVRFGRHHLHLDDALGLVHTEG